MKTIGVTALTLLAAASGAAAFAPPPAARPDLAAAARARPPHENWVTAARGRFRYPQRAPTATEDTDFDAPVPRNPQSGSTVLDHDIVVVDDECYLGKYGQFDDCVDFDPIHVPNEKASSEATDAKAKAEMPDFSKLGDEILNALKSSPLGSLFK